MPDWNIDRKGYWSCLSSLDFGSWRLLGHPTASQSDKGNARHSNELWKLTNRIQRASDQSDRNTKGRNVPSWHDIIGLCVVVRHVNKHVSCNMNIPSCRSRSAGFSRRKTKTAKRAYTYCQIEDVDTGSATSKCVMRHYLTLNSQRIRGYPFDYWIEWYDVVHLTEMNLSLTSSNGTRAFSLNMCYVWISKWDDDDRCQIANWWAAWRTVWYWLTRCLTWLSWLTAGYCRILVAL